MSDNNDEMDTIIENLSIQIVEKYFKLPNNNTITKYLYEFVVERKLNNILEKKNIFNKDSLIVNIDSIILELQSSLSKESLQEEFKLLSYEFKKNF